MDLNLKIFFRRSHCILLIATLLQLSALKSVSSQGILTEDCTWESSTGRKYDLNSLRHKEEWIVKDGTSSKDNLFSLEYHFNICQNTKQFCQNQQPGAFIALDVLGEETDTCEVLGQQSSTTV